MPGFPKWTDLRLRTKGLIVIAAPAAATVMIACASYVIGSRAVAAEQAVRQTLRAGAEIHRLKFNEIAASAEIRAFFLSEEPEYVMRARRRIADSENLRQRLAGLVAGNAEQLDRLARISILHRSRAERIYGAAARFAVGALPPRSLAGELRAGDAELVKIEGLLDGMTDEANRVLARETAAVEDLQEAMQAVMAACALLSVFGGIAISLMFATGITNRIVLLRQNVARLATGESLSRLPEGRDEIGALSHGFAHAAGVLKRRSAALENALQGIAEADAEGRHVRYNKAYAVLASLGEVRDAPNVEEIVQPEDRDRMREAIGRMRATGKAELETCLVSASGNTAPVAVTLLDCDDANNGYFVFLRDIAERKENEAALVLAKDAAVASQAARTRFLAKVSHDIRTPLNAILGAADLLSMTELSADQLEYVEMFQRNSHRLVALINDFLDFSKIEAGAVHLERAPLRLRESVEEAVATFRETAARKGIGLQAEFAADLPEWVIGDALRVQQVLVNLLSNGLKFTQAGRVRVTVSKTGAAGEVMFEVADTGPGIPPQDKERIFAEYEQLPNQGAAGQGCGLGLLICRELVERMNGTMTLESEVGLGSVFRFVLPLESADPVSREARTSREAQPANHGAEVLRVLAAEDTEDNRRLLRHYTRGEAIELRFACNGQEAVDAIRAGGTFDLVLLDLDMPVLDGVQAARAIREWQVARQEAVTPIVGLSAHVLEEAVRECMQAGCVAHVAKPIDKRTLLTTIRKYARRPPPEAPELCDEVRELVPWYLCSVSKRIEEARQHLAAKNLDPVRRFAHNLRGTGAGYGFPMLAEVGTEIEEMMPAGDEQGIARQLELLHRFVAAQQQMCRQDPAPALSGEDRSANS